jgi:hypothetical protein
MSARRRGAAIAGTAALVFASTVVVAESANAAIYDCNISGSRAKCANVTGIDPGSWLQVRTGPGYGYPDQPGFRRLYNGDSVGLSCWTTGDGAIDNPNWKYWIRVDTGTLTGYVNDWYLETGSPAQFKAVLREC